MKDPHVWLDPALARRQVDAIASGLARIDPAGEAGYRERAARYTAALSALDDAFKAGLAACARREVVTSHAAFGYLTRRYGSSRCPWWAWLCPPSQAPPISHASCASRARPACRRCSTSHWRARSWPRRSRARSGRARWC
jgi:zinc transport system substrate-binding protein